jgi:hypothetical protein
MHMAFAPCPRQPVVLVYATQGKRVPLSPRPLTVTDHGVCCQCSAGRVRPSGRGTGASRVLPPRLPHVSCTSLVQHACHVRSEAFCARPCCHGISRDVAIHHAALLRREDYEPDSPWNVTGGSQRPQGQSSPAENFSPTSSRSGTVASLVARDTAPPWMWPRQCPACGVPPRSGAHPHGRLARDTSAIL